MIRQATLNDYQQWYDLSVNLWKATPYRNIPVDGASVFKVFSQCLNSRLGCVYVAEHSGRLTGTIMGVAEEIWWSRKRQASDILFYSQFPGDGDELLNAFLCWAWALPGVAEVMLGQSSGLHIDESKHVYLRAGLQHIGGMYFKAREAA